MVDQRLKAGVFRKTSLPLGVLMRAELALLAYYLPGMKKSVSATLFIATAVAQQTPNHFEPPN